MIDVRLVSAESHVKVHPDGHLVTGPREYNQSVFNELAEPATAYLFYEPKAHHVFLVTGFLAYGDKQVSAVTNATVVIYEAVSPTTTAVDKVLLQFELGQNQALPMTGLNLLASEGRWILAKTDDDDVHMTILGYYLPVVPG